MSDQEGKQSEVDGASRGPLPFLAEPDRPRPWGLRLGVIAVPAPDAGLVEKESTHVFALSGVDVETRCSRPRLAERQCWR